MDEDRELIAVAFGPGRASTQRLAIARAARSLKGAFSVEGLERAARLIDPGIGTATVYRAVGAMTSTGYLERVGTRDGRALYARCEIGGHHHHLVCTSCGAVAEAPCPLADRWADAAARDGFVVTDHDVTLYGVCGECVRDEGRP